MMYRIKTKWTEPHLTGGVIHSGSFSQRVIPATLTTLRNCKDSEEVLKEIPHLLDMISEGKVNSIMITEL